MKFYNIPVLVQTENRTLNLGDIVVEHGIHGYREAITKIPLQIWSKDMTNEQQEMIQSFGFYFSIMKRDCIEKHFAKKEDVEVYLMNIENHPFHQFVEENQYVYGTDHNEVKQMIKEYRKKK